MRSLISSGDQGERFSSFRLPENLYMKAVNCNGIPNAYFFREDDRPTIRFHRASSRTGKSSEMAKI